MISYGAPTKVTPAKGYITAFNRSYYEEVLITKVHGLIDQKEADKRLKHIQHFEKLLTDSGILIIKIFLHISPEFQLDKIKERMENPEKLWKFDPKRSGGAAVLEGLYEVVSGCF